MNYREKIRKAIECPQFGNETYGEWGALRFEQRVLIKRLLDELDRADNYFKKVYLENQELKKKYENAVVDYETTMFEKEQLNSLVNSCQEKIRQLKKQLEESKDNYNCLLKQKEQFEYIMSKQVDYQGQKKEFINYLEDEKDRLIKETSHYYIDSFDRQHSVNETIYDEVDMILQKYKEIIGVSNEKK